MDLNILPLIKLSPIKRITASRYFSFKLCKLRAILAHNNQPPLTPISPSARVGNISHKLLQMVIKGKITDEKDIQPAWDQTCKEVEEQMNKNPLERHMVPLELNASDFEIKKLMTFTAIHNLLKKRGSIILTGKLPRCEAEKWLETSDGKIGGRIDLIKHTKLGIEILDYKTGPIIDPLSEDSSPELKYQQQLKLSAAIYYDAEKKWPSKLVILGLDQKEYIINFSEKECLQILDAAKRDLEEINQRILAGENPKEFANPSPESCKYCVYRPACSAYWNQREDNIHWPNDFMGYIKEKKILGNGLFRVILDNSIKKIAIRGLSTNRHGFLKNNIKSVMFCNLRRDQAEEDYTEDMLTVGYSI